MILSHPASMLAVLGLTEPLYTVIVMMLVSGEWFRVNTSRAEVNSDSSQ